MFTFVCSSVNSRWHRSACQFKIVAFCNLKRLWLSVKWFRFITWNSFHSFSCSREEQKHRTKIQHFHSNFSHIAIMQNVVIWNVMSGRTTCSILKIVEKLLVWMTRKWNGNDVKLDVVAPAILSAHAHSLYAKTSTAATNMQFTIHFYIRFFIHFTSAK